MIRQPTSFAQAYAWHRKALAEGVEAATMHDGEIHAGFYRMRLVRGGPFVPVRIWIEAVTDPKTGELAEPERFRAEIEGIEVSPQQVADRWTHMTPISSAEFKQLVDLRLRVPGMIDSRRPLDLTENPVTP